MTNPATRHESRSATERLLTFEIAGGVYALPLDRVLEVADVTPISCIPTVSARVAGVVNYHGDALPIAHRAMLLALPDADENEPQQIVVIADEMTGAARVGLPVDRVLGLVDSSAGTARGEGVVCERRTVADRVVSVLDPKRLIARAQEAIQDAHPTNG